MRSWAILRLGSKHCPRPQRRPPSLPKASVKAFGREAMMRRVWREDILESLFGAGHEAPALFLSNMAAAELLLYDPGLLRKGLGRVGTGVKLAHDPNNNHRRVGTRNRMSDIVNPPFTSMISTNSSRTPWGAARV